MVKRSRTNKSGESDTNIKYDVMHDIDQVKLVEIFVPDELYNNTQSDKPSFGNISMDSEDFSPNARESLFKKTFSLDKESSE